MGNIFDGLGQRLRKVRLDNDLSQTEMAKILGHKKPEVVSRFETGKRFPSVEAIVKLHDKLKIDLNWLLTGRRDLNHALEILVDRGFLNDYYSTESEKYKEVRKAVSSLESKRQDGQQLTDKEVESLLANKKAESVLMSRLTMLTNHLNSTTTPLKGLLDNLLNEPPTPDDPAD
jgi:transcriptional regulator with XRE-family HTH domain